MNDLIGGHVDFFCEQSVSVAGQAKSGAIKAYAVSAAERLPALPNVPTAKESGINYLMSIWAGIFAPKGTPPDVVDKLAGALDKALDDDSVRMRINELGGSIPGKAERSPAAFDAYVKGEIARWAPILKSAAEPRSSQSCPSACTTPAAFTEAGPFSDLGVADELRQISGERRSGATTSTPMSLTRFCTAAIVQVRPRRR